MGQRVSSQTNETIENGGSFISSKTIKNEKKMDSLTYSDKDIKITLIHGDILDE